ncbi:hypothetical protein [Rhodococcus sp. HNM0569]|uniref:SCO6745 family protein n=1 Tax=Rhodococcus sp. HNM0569 TaxID=2716340 RepID=UPI00146D8B7B|nr:hypothetical protein [Rhodococcus sp. HNM0569]NLU83046.1 hypothetical protein [Rhodococcus sp. HNM0569]
MNPEDSGLIARRLEPLHSFTYFAPEVDAALVDAGLEGGPMTYFAGRAAPLGAVGPAIVTSTFFNFAPVAAEASIPRAWSLASPAAVVAARVRGVDAAYRRVLGDDALRSPEFAEAAELASIAAHAIPGTEGRPLAAAYRALDWPEQPHLVLWHALTLLREYRGDGHISALVTAGLSGLDALVTHTASGYGFSEKFARRSRGWTEQQWAAGVSALRDRELLDDAGALTEMGREIRTVVEDLTDDLATAPWSALGEDGARRLGELAQPWIDEVRAAKIFPPGTFGPRHGSAR